MKLWYCSTALILYFSIGYAENSYHTPGLWLLPRMDSTNMARSDITGTMSSEPEEVWCMTTGGSVGYTRPVTIKEKDDAALVLVGSNLELRSWDGRTFWRFTRENVRRIMHVGDFNNDGREEVMALCSSRTAKLYDLVTGRTLWSWDAPSSSVIARSQYYRTQSGIRFITFPIYSVQGFCFDFSDNIEKPELLWGKDFTGNYTTGYGPGVILKDMDGDGQSDIVLSAKYVEQKEEKTSYHAVLDIDSGDIKFDIYTQPDSSAPVILGRPYGLLQVVDLDNDRLPDIVMVSCQVEEYIQLLKNNGSRFEKKWGKFIEKDWPEDDRELRPQVTSLSDITGDGTIEMVLGLWDNGAWSTVVIDPLTGFEAQRATLPGYYFWGCDDVTGEGRLHGSDGIIASLIDVIGHHLVGHAVSLLVPFASVVDVPHADRNVKFNIGDSWRIGCQITGSGDLLVGWQVSAGDDIAELGVELLIGMLELLGKAFDLL